MELVGLKHGTDLAAFLHATLAGKGKVSDYTTFAEEFDANWATASKFFVFLSAKYCTYTAEFLGIIRDNILPLTEKYPLDYVKIAVIQKFYLEYFGLTTTRFICASTLGDGLSYGERPNTTGDVHTAGNIALVNIFAILNKNGEYLVKDFKELKLCRNATYSFIGSSDYGYKVLKRLNDMKLFTFNDLLLFTKALWLNESFDSRFDRIFLVKRSADSERSPELYNSMFPIIYSSKRTFTSDINVFLSNPFITLYHYAKEYGCKAVAGELRKFTDEFTAYVLNAFVEMNDGLCAVSKTRLLLDELVAVYSETYLPRRFNAAFPVSLLTDTQKGKIKEAVMNLLTNESLGRDLMERDETKFFATSEGTKVAFETINQYGFRCPIMKVSKYNASSFYSSEVIKRNVDNKVQGGSCIVNGYSAPDFLKIIYADIESLEDYVTTVMDKTVMEEAMDAMQDANGLVYQDRVMTYFNSVAKNLSNDVIHLVVSTLRILTNNMALSSNQEPAQVVTANSISNIVAPDKISYLRYLITLLERDYDDTELFPYVDLLERIYEASVRMYFLYLDSRPSINSTAENNIRMQRSIITNMTGMLPFTSTRFISGMFSIFTRMENVKYEDGGVLTSSQYVMDILASYKETYDILKGPLREEFDEFVDSLDNKAVVGIINSHSKFGESQGIDEDVVTSNTISSLFLSTRGKVVAAQAKNFVGNLRESFELANDAMDYLFESTMGDDCKFRVLRNS